MMIEATSDQWTMLIHDLRNPLATVHGCTRLLLRRAAERDSQMAGLDEGLRHIQDAASRLERLIDQLAASPELPAKHRQASARSLTDMVRLARQIAAQTQPLAGTPDRITVLPAVRELVGHWDPIGMERVLGNLLDNALKYSPVDRPVIVTVRRDGLWAVISVADQGIGIASADYERVFEHGYRAPDAAVTAPGQGIGLAAVRSIVHAHGGTISVDSQEGIGTTVTVRLPLRQPATPAAALGWHTEL